MPGTPTQLVVIMGVSGCGKSTVGGLLAEAIGADFLEGDDLHAPRNVERMAAGIPLTDDDRRDWLRALAQRLRVARDAHRSLVVSCSALKRSYRDVLREASAELAFVHLHADMALLEARLSARTDHFMPPSLLASQLRTLEAPGPGECALTFDATLPPATIAARAAAWLNSTTPTPAHSP